MAKDKTIAVIDEPKPKFEANFKCKTSVCYQSHKNRFIR